MRGAAAARDENKPRRSNASRSSPIRARVNDFAVARSRKRLILLVPDAENRAKAAVVQTKAVSLAGDLWILQAVMFLRAKIRKKDGKRHRYWSVVENKRVAGGRVVQRHVLYLGEINDWQELAWRRSIEVLDEAAEAAQDAVAVSRGSLRRRLCRTARLSG